MLQVYESTHTHQQAVMQLQDKLMNLEGRASQHQNVLETATKKHLETVERLQQEKAMLEVKLQAQEKEVYVPPIELYISTRGRTGDASCTNVTGPQGDTRTILHAC